jgi:hypothetical protein
VRYLPIMVIHNFMFKSFFVKFQKNITKKSITKIMGIVLSIIIVIIGGVLSVAYGKATEGSFVNIKDVITFSILLIILLLAVYVIQKLSGVWLNSLEIIHRGTFFVGLFLLILVFFLLGAFLVVYPSVEGGDLVEAMHTSISTGLQKTCADLVTGEFHSISSMKEIFYCWEEISKSCNAVYSSCIARYNSFISESYAYFQLLYSSWVTSLNSLSLFISESSAYFQQWYSCCIKHYNYLMELQMDILLPKIVIPCLLLYTIYYFKRLPY